MEVVEFEFFLGEIRLNQFVTIVDPCGTALVMEGERFARSARSE